MGQYRRPTSSLPIFMHGQVSFRPLDSSLASVRSKKACFLLSGAFSPSFMTCLHNILSGNIFCRDLHLSEASQATQGRSFPHTLIQAHRHAHARTHALEGMFMDEQTTCLHCAVQCEPYSASFTDQSTRSVNQNLATTIVPVE